jgi:hypothetical protein
MKPTAPLRNDFSVFATTPYRSPSLSREMVARTFQTKQLGPSAALLLLLLLPSCSGTFDVHPSGSIQEGIIFTFYKVDAPHPSRFRISNLIVQQHTSSGWKFIWALDGAQPLTAITYGAAYPRLTQNRQAPRLLRGQLYRVAVSSDGLYGGADFLIDPIGHVVVRPPTL